MTRTLDRPAAAAPLAARGLVGRPSARDRGQVVVSCLGRDRVVLAGEGQAPVVLSCREAAIALELSGVPVDPGADVPAIAALVLDAVDRLGIDAVRGRDTRDPMCAVLAVDLWHGTRARDRLRR